MQQWQREGSRWGRRKNKVIHAVRMGKRGSSCVFTHGPRHSGGRGSERRQCRRGRRGRRQTRALALLDAVGDVLALVLLAAAPAPFEAAATAGDVGAAVDALGGGAAAGAAAGLLLLP